MTANVIDAIIHLIQNPILDLQQNYIGRNRANSMGDALERYVQDLFIHGFDMAEPERNEAIAEHFCYLGNASNPPDAMLKGGDALEIKKIESRNSDLALNSSYPKAILNIENPMLTSSCRGAEDWTEKDMLYAVGIVEKNKLKALAFVYGVDYAADENIYNAIKHRIKLGVETIEGIEFIQTKELGKINRIDPLGITYLRVRGMWGIQNPFKAFDYVYQRNFSHQFNLMAIVNENKWQTFSNTQKLIEVIEMTPCASIQDIKIKNPNNPAQLKPAKLIQFSILGA